MPIGGSESGVFAILPDRLVVFRCCFPILEREITTPKSLISLQNHQDYVGEIESPTQTMTLLQLRDEAKNRCRCGSVSKWETGSG
jgi:hypothetical protein